MKKKFTSILVLFTFFTIAAIAQGYSGKHNLLKVNLTHLPSNKFTAEYERSVAYHFSLLAHVTRWSEEDQQEHTSENVKATLFGGGFRLYEKTAYPAPKGRFMYIGFEGGKGTLNGWYRENNSINGTKHTFTNEELAISAATLAFGSQFFIVKGLTLEYLLGFKAISYSWQTESEGIYEAVSRLQFELFAPSYYGDQSYDPNKYLGINPMLDVKIGYAF